MVRTDVVLSPGQYASYPGSPCILLPAGAAGDLYRVAVARPSLISEDTTNVATVTLAMSAVLTPAAAGPDVRPPFPAAVASGDDDLPLLDGTRALEHLRRMDATRAFEMDLRRRELALGLGGARVLPSRAPAGPARVDPPATTTMYVDLSCSATAVKRPVTRVGFSDNLVIYQLTSEFSTGPISATAAGLMLDYYDSYVKDMIVAYWGPIPDADTNGRIIVVTTTALDDGVAAAVYSGDYYSTADCPSSNQGEVIYFDGSLIRELDPADPETDPFALGVVAHEAKHVISLYNGFQRNTPTPAPNFHELWVEEGTAEISSEMSSRLAWAATGGPAVNAAITRTAILQAVQANGGEATAEMSALIDHLAGIVRSLSSRPNSVINDPVGAEDGHSFYHMSWHWHRFLGDGYGDASSFAQADSSFFRLLSSPSTPAGGASGELLLTGSTFDELFEDFVVAVSLHGSGFTAPNPITTWDFVTAGDVFTTPNPTGSYPWPVTATSTTQWVPFGSAAYTGGIGLSGVRFHDFRSSGSTAAQIQVSGAADGVIVVTRLD
jgi:hypothetical protein